MGLSSNTILHTTSKSSLLKILAGLYFKPKYCYEKIHSKEEFFNVAFPMVSFSDFPVSELKYRQSYGKYGIGLSKIWARKNKLNPVLYIEKNSQLIENYYKYFDKIQSIDESSGSHDMFFQMLAYMKNYQGALIIPKLYINEPNYRFSDEREWRYVPDNSILKPHKISPHYNGDYYEKNKELCNSKLVPIKLQFSIDDINYIILDKETDRDFFIDYVLEKHPTMITSKKNKLISRIISMTRIQNDF